MKIILGFSSAWFFVAAFITASFAAGGDNIRGVAPVTALILDAREGNAGPLKEAFFEKQIDYFLDFEQGRSKIVAELANIREAGRAIEANDFSQADQRIRGIQNYPDQKQYLRAVLDAAQGRYQQSLEGFRQLIDRREDLGSKRIIMLAFMGAARVFHEIQDYKAAVYHYNQVRQLESEFFQSVFEKGWSLYLNGDMNGALGATLTFESPFFESAFYPEAAVVRTAAFFQLCYFDRASGAAQDSKRHWEPIQRQIRELAARDPRSWLFDERLLKSINKPVMGALIMDSQFRTAIRARIALEKEVRALGGRREAALASQALSLVKNKLINESGRVLRNADKLITEMLSQMDLIAIEILQASANQILGRPPDEQAMVKIIDLGNVDFDAQVQFWPFKGEFWVDELGSYYYGLKSNCDSDGMSSSKISKAYADARRHRPYQITW